MIFTGDFRYTPMITWKISKVCNFDCAYCFNQKPDLQNLKPVSIETLSEGLDRLKNDWLIHISGGEPFLEKNFIDICRTITNKHYLSLNSNLSTRNVYDFAENISPDRTLFISASVHITVREKRDLKLKAYIKKLLTLQTKGFNVIASYVAHPLQFNRIKSDIEYLRASGIQKVKIKIFRGVYNEKYYPKAFVQDDKKFLETLEADYPEYEILTKSFGYYGQLCRAGQSFFVMDRSGNLTRCSSLHRKYGNLFQKTFKWDDEARPCTANKCGCPYEGIRTIKTTRGKAVSIIREDLVEKSIKLRRVIDNPKSLLKIKQKVIEYFA
jgi:MoaA/NifB/PqqE/SkfB family radical SAM enzyme